MLEKVLEKRRNRAKKKAPATNETVDIQGLCSGSPSWTRTNDPAVNSRMLYQLSY